jgi:hypothetical protein
VIKGAVEAEKLYKLVDKQPRHAIYWYSKKLGWSYGKTHRAMDRLQKEGLVRFTYELDGGRMHKKVRPIEPDEIEVEL